MVLPILNQLAGQPERPITVADVFLNWNETTDAVLGACGVAALPELDPAVAAKAAGTGWLQD